MKIPSPYEQHPITGKAIIGVYTHPKDIQLLESDFKWIVQEKVKGHSLKFYIDLCGKEVTKPVIDGSQAIVKPSFPLLETFKVYLRELIYKYFEGKIDEDSETLSDMSYVFRGVVFGKDIRGNIYGLKGLSYYVYDILVNSKGLSLEAQELLIYEIFGKEKWFVPELYERQMGIFSEIMNIITLRGGAESVINEGIPLYGLVIKPRHPLYSNPLRPIIYKLEREDFIRLSLEGKK